MFIPGQRWYSSTEPELGLGTVLRLSGRQVQLVFTGCGTLRHYAIGGAPLLRAAFKPGDRVRVSGNERMIESAEETEGLIRYAYTEGHFNEGELDAEQPVSQADAKLLSGRVDRNDQFEFRRECLQRHAEARAHPGWGILGARIDLIPHQLCVAEVAVERRLPRLLLADEVGLGKTIEACLIVAQLLASGRASRICILLPESLVNQWFVELLRRFNLSFAVFDEERCEAIEMSNSERNPFEDEQCVIASLDWLSSHEKRARQILKAPWDLLLVDEAHHLIWTEALSSPGYQLVEAMSKRIAGLLLLTATPEQLGIGGHFARLRLLDSARYTDLNAFVAEQERYISISALADRIANRADLNAHDLEALAAFMTDEKDQLTARFARIVEGDSAEREALLSDLIDRHGTGRVMIRNRRALVGGFPKRIPHITALDDSDDDQWRARLHAEFMHDIGDSDDEPEHDFTRDPRMDWLLTILEDIAPNKALVLCRSRAKVQALEEAFRMRSGMPVARFHEDMNLLQRDRNAAYFAEADGARCLIASEIGAEGRNFQFAQHLIFWDLPLHPDMLEQRIGRLDRIGQRGDVHIHSAALPGSPQEALLRWYHEGLNAFTQVLADGRECLIEHGDELIELAELDAESREPALSLLINKTAHTHQLLAQKIAEGRDHLLEMSSRRGTADSTLLKACQDDDLHAEHDDYVLRLFEQFGIHHEALSPKIWLLDPEMMTVDGFETLKSGPRPASFDRATAIARDDLLYLRLDHPMVLSAQDMLISSDKGNTTLLIDDALPARTVILEAVYVLECIAEKQLNIERFLPPMPLSIVVDTRLQIRPDFIANERAAHRAGDRVFDLGSMRKVLSTLIPPMLEKTRTHAVELTKTEIDAACEKADGLLRHEIKRLQLLASKNPAVRPEDIVLLQTEHQQLQTRLPQARARLDSLRLIASPDFLSMRR
jgi:ATP-dependent helicase HepA